MEVCDGGTDDAGYQEQKYDPEEHAPAGAEAVVAEEEAPNGWAWRRGREEGLEFGVLVVIRRGLVQIGHVELLLR